MAIEFLGATLDIHAGGVDLIFPHHENEIAQSEALTGQPFARYWLHSEFLLVDGQKMSKSLGNFYTLRDLCEERGFSPESIRYLLASVPYRKGLNFTFDGLRSAQTAIDRLRNFKLRLESEKLEDGLSTRFIDVSAATFKAFREALEDDINTAEALAAIFEYVRECNTAMDRGEFLSLNQPTALAVLEKFDSFFDVLKKTEPAAGLSDGEIDGLIAERTAAKKARDFGRADQIRAQLLEQGVILEDTKGGVRWKRK
jgi:cysteinyl-tRNA synthetase